MARTSLRTKLYEALADQLTDIVVDAVLTIARDDQPTDLFMARRFSYQRYLNLGGGWELHICPGPSRYLIFTFHVLDTKFREQARFLF